MRYNVSTAMNSLSLNPLILADEPFDPVAEVARLESLLQERQDELTSLQAELFEFKTRYAQIVGCRLAELAEVEGGIKMAEARLQVGEDNAAAEVEAEDRGRDGKLRDSEKSALGGSMRKLFWSVAKLFHPDHAADEREAAEGRAALAEEARRIARQIVKARHRLTNLI